MRFKTIFLQSSHLLSSSTLQIGIGFFANLILVRILDLEDFGTYAIIFATIALIRSIFTFNTGMYAIRVKTLSPQKLGELYVLCILEIIISSIIVLSYAAYTNLHLGLVALALVTGGLQSLFGVKRAAVEREMDYKNLALVELFASGMSQTIAIALAFVGAGIYSLFFRDLMLGSLLGVGLHFFTKPTEFVLPKSLRLNYFAYFRNIGPIYIDQIVERAISRITIIMVDQFAGPASAGLFFQAERIAMLHLQFTQPVLSRFSLNFFSRNSVSERKHLLIVFALSSCTFGVMLTGLSYVWLEDLIRFIYGEKWTPAYKIFLALFGTVILLPTLELIKSLYYSKNDILGLIILRTASTIGLVAVILFALSTNTVSAVSMAFAISSAIVLSVAASTVHVFAKRRY